MNKQPGFVVRSLLIFGFTASVLAVAGTARAAAPISPEAVNCTADPVVTTNADSGAGSLRQAIADACVDSTITFDMAQVVSPIALTSGALSADKNLVISGPGASQLTITRGTDNNNSFSIFLATGASPTTITLSGLTVTKGGGPQGGIGNTATGTLNVLRCVARNNLSSLSGGGINNSLGVLNVVATTVDSNTAPGDGGGIRNGGGTVSITDTTVSNNSSFFSGTGGGISNGASNGAAGTIAITNSTISNNSISGFGSAKGGGVINNSPGTITITNSTIANNTGASGAGVANASTGQIKLVNTIVALNTGSTTSPDLNGAFVTLGHNLIGRSDGSTGFTAGANGDLVGTIASPLDPQLGSLADNGGPTATKALSNMSVALDAGDNSAVTTPPLIGPPYYDQRETGFPRIANGTVDIGAFELPSTTTPTPTPTATASPSATATATPTATASPTPTATATASPTPAATATATATPTPTATPEPTVPFVARHYFTSNYFSRVITEYNRYGNAVRSLTISSALGDEVKGLAFGADGLLYAVVSRGSAGFAVIALKSDGSVAMTYTGSSYVSGNLSSGKVALDNQYLYVAGAGQVTRFLLGAQSSGTVIFGTGSGVYDIKPLPNGNLFVALQSEIDEITTSGTFVRRIQLTGGESFTDIRGIEYNPATNVLFVTHLGHTNFEDRIMRVDASTGALLGNAVFNYADDLFLDSDGKLLVGSRTQSPKFYSQDLVPGNSLNGGQQMFVTQYVPPGPPGNAGNVSTRLPVGTGEDVLIEGFIVDGPAGSTKKIIVRAIGPSLLSFGVADALPNPTLEIHDASGATVATNNDWKTTQVGGLITGDQSAEINNTGVAPGNDFESAIIADLAPGSYTGVVRGMDNQTGTGVVDAYDLSGSSPAKLANIATRGLVQAGDKLMIAGFIIQNGPVETVIRAIGPSLLAFGINNALADTTLELRDVNGQIVLANDNWESDQKQALEAAGLAPSHQLEAALITNIAPGSYTAQVRGKDNASGIGVVQVYFLQ